MLDPQSCRRLQTHLRLCRLRLRGTFRLRRLPTAGAGCHPAATALEGPRAVLLGHGRRPRPTCRGGPGLVFPARPRPGGRGPEEDPGQSSPAAAAAQAGGGARPKGNGCPEGKGSLAVPCRPSMPRSPGVHCRSTGLSAILRGISRCPSRPIGRQRKCVSLVAVEGANAARSRPKGGGPSRLVPPLAARPANVAAESTTHDGGSRYGRPPRLRSAAHLSGTTRL